MGRNSCRYSDSPRAGRSGVRFPAGGEIFRTGPDRPWDPLSLLVSFPGEKQPGRGVDHPSPLVKVIPFQAGVAHRVCRGIALLFHDRGIRMGWVVSNTPRPHFNPGKTRYPFYRGLCGAQGRSGQAENLVPTGIRSRTVQPVISRYTDWATGPTHPN